MHLIRGRIDTCMGREDVRQKESECIGTVLPKKALTLRFLMVDGCRLNMKPYTGDHFPGEFVEIGQITVQSCSCLQSWIFMSLKVV